MLPVIARLVAALNESFLARAHSSDSDATTPANNHNLAPPHHRRGSAIGITTRANMMLRNRIV